MILSHGMFLGMRNVSDKIVEKIKTHFVFSNIFLNIVPCMRYCGKTM